MKIVISPSKDMNTDDRTLNETRKSCTFQKEADLLRDKLIGLELTMLIEAYGVSEKIALKAKTLLEEKRTGRAISIYNGAVFKSLSYSSLGNEEKEYIGENLIILSAMYGALSTSDLISPYRLDMKTKVTGISLYSFWEGRLDYLFKRELVIDLSSNEFSKIIAGVEKIRIEFKEMVEGKPVIKATYAKIARGAFLKEMAIKRVTSVEELKALSALGYQYSKEHSSENELVYIR